MMTTSIRTLMRNRERGRRAPGWRPRCFLRGSSGPSAILTAYHRYEPARHVLDPADVSAPSLAAGENEERTQGEEQDSVDLDTCPNDTRAALPVHASAISASLSSPGGTPRSSLPPQAGRPGGPISILVSRGMRPTSVPARKSREAARATPGWATAARSPDAIRSPRGADGLRETDCGRGEHSFAGSRFAGLGSRRPILVRPSPASMNLDHHHARRDGPAERILN